MAQPHKKRYNFFNNLISEPNPYGMSVGCSFKKLATNIISPIFQKFCDKSLYTLGTDGRLSFNFHWIDDKDFSQKYKNALESIGFPIPANFNEVRPSVSSDEWVIRAEEFVRIVGEVTI